jgi:hypothetical protein
MGDAVGVDVDVWVAPGRGVTLERGLPDVMAGDAAGDGDGDGDAASDGDEDGLATAVADARGSPEGDVEASPVAEALGDVEGSGVPVALRIVCSGSDPRGSRARPSTTHAPRPARAVMSRRSLACRSGCGRTGVVRRTAAPLTTRRVGGTGRGRPSESVTTSPGIGSLIWSVARGR